MAAEDAPHGTAVAARIQSAGRGTRGRVWSSTEGGLWLSVICRPRGGEADLAVLGLRIGLALAEHLDRLLPAAPPGGRGPRAEPPRHRILIKWPNDLLVGDAKLGGVLCEARWQGERLGWMIAGIGLNLHNPLPQATGFPVTRLADAGSSAAPADLAEPVASLVATATRRAGPLEPAELARFAARDWLRGRPVIQPFAGTALGITSRGQLRIQAPDGAVREVADSLALQLR